MKNLFTILFSFCLAAQALGITVVNDPPTDADLLTIEVQQGSLTYNEETGAYEITLQYPYSDSDYITVTPRNDDAVVTGAGPVSGFRVDEWNDFRIHVECRGVTKDYTVSFYVFGYEGPAEPEEPTEPEEPAEPEDPTAVIRDVSITLAGVPGVFTPAFASDIYEYHCTTSADNITIAATAASGCRIEGGLGNHALAMGENRIILTGISADNQRHDYTFIVTRTATPSITVVNKVETDADLLTIGLLHGNIYYNEESDYYWIILPFSGNNSILVTTRDPGAIVTGAGPIPEWHVGWNEFSVHVVGPSGTTKDYSVRFLVGELHPAVILDVSLTLAGEPGVFTPAFASNHYEYRATIPAEEITIAATAASDCRIDGLGNHTLEIGENRIVITGITADNQKYDYTFIVTRTIPSITVVNEVETDADLLTIGVLHGIPAYDAAEDRYWITLQHPISGNEFIAVTTRDLRAVVTGAGPVSGLHADWNHFTVHVVGPSGTTKDYRVSFYIPPHPVKIQDLSLTMAGKPGIFTPAFAADCYEYRCTTSADKITVAGTAVSGCSIDGLGQYTLTVGENPITITGVTADNQKYDYTFIVTRTATPSIMAVNTVETDADLLTIGVLHGFLYYDELRDVYKTENLTAQSGELISVTTRHPDATVTGAGKINLTDGVNELKIRVVGPSGAVKEYMIAYTFTSQPVTIQDLSLTVENQPGIFMPTFSPAVHEYHYTTPAGEITLSGTLAPGCDVTGLGKHTLAAGENRIVVTGIPANGDRDEYVLVITREVRSAVTVVNNPVTDADLLTISLDRGSLTYDAYDDNYWTLVVPPPFSGEAFITVTKRNAAAVVTGDGAVSGLRFGYNNHRLHVTGPSGATKEYTVTFAVASHAPVIANLSVTANNKPLVYAPAWATDIYAYHTTTSATQITIVATPASGCQVSGTGIFQLAPGDNLFPIVGTTSSGSQYTYTLTVTRLESGDLTAITVVNDTVTDADLLTIAVQQGTLYYDGEDPYWPTYRTDLKNPFSTTDYILVSKRHPDAVVTGDGPVSGLHYDFNDRRIQVTGPSGAKKEYVVTFYAAPRVILLQDWTITLDGRPAAFTPAFSPNTYDYFCTTSAQTISVAGSVPSGNRVTGLGNYTLKPGNNMIAVSGTASDGASYTYHFVVTRTEKPSITVWNNPQTDADLLTVAVNQGFLYYPDVDNEPNTIWTRLSAPFSTTDYISVTTRDPEAVVTGAGPVSGLENGWNYRTIHVKGQSGTEKDYTVTFVVYAPSGIETPLLKDETVSVYNLSGLLIGTRRTDALQGLPAGFYILKGRNSGVSKKILVK